MAEAEKISMANECARYSQAQATMSGDTNSMMRSTYKRNKPSDPSTACKSCGAPKCPRLTYCTTGGIDAGYRDQ